MKAMLWADHLVRRAERMGWVVLVLFALVVPWSGVEPPMAGSVGVGYVAMDATVTALLWAAALAQLARIIQADPREHITIRTGAWLMQVTLCLLAGRMTWLLVAWGDIKMTATMVLALTCLSLAVLLHAAGRVIYGAEHNG